MAVRIASVLGATLRLVGSLLLRVEAKAALHRWACSALPQFGVHTEVTGNLSDEAPLWVANHLSWLDPLVLMQFRPMSALAKSEVTAYPLLGTIVQRLELAFVDRSDATSRGAAVARLSREFRNGCAILLFPEGTTTTGAGLARLQEGGLRAAFRCGTAVQTIRIASHDPEYPWIGDEELLPHLDRIIRNPLTTVRIHAGAVLEPRQFPCEDTWIEAIRQQLLPAP